MTYSLSSQNDYPFAALYCKFSCVEMALGQNGTAFATDFSNTAAFNVSSGQTSWTYPGSIVEATYGGGASVYDSNNNIVQIDSQGNAGTPSCSGCLEPMGLSLWTPSFGAPGLISGPKEMMEASAFPLPQGNRQGQKQTPKLSVATFMPSIPGAPGSRFGTEDLAVKDITSSLSPSKFDRRMYSRSIGPRLATVNNFINENAPTQADVLGFIGHSVFANDENTGAREAVGLILADNDLIRTPDCTAFGNALGICFFLDDRKKPDGTPAKNPPCLPGIVNNAEAVEIVSYDGTTSGCYLLPLFGGLVAQRTPVILTSAKVVFVAACDTSSTFTGWWDMNLNAQPGGRALVVPDLAAMATMQINQGLNISPDFVDLQQGAVAWERLLNSLAAGNSVQKAVDDANSAIDAFYGTISNWPPPIGRLAQVKLKVVGNPNARAN